MNKQLNTDNQSILMSSEEYQFLTENNIIQRISAKSFKVTNPCFVILDKNNLNKDFFKQRNRFAHKGNFGHAILIGGSMGKGGACVLASRSCMRTGCGLLSVHIPKCLNNIMQISCPETMTEQDCCEEYFTQTFCTDKYSAVGIGPGIGTNEKTSLAVINLLKKNKRNVVIDADALNILATTEQKHEILNNHTIITPHPKEFVRLFGTFTSYYDRIMFIKDYSVKYGVTIVLKGGITAIACNDGTVYFNILGNPGMATAGSGDVLTGIILGILSQGYSCADAAKLGVYLHALSGDTAKSKGCEQSLTASDIVNNLCFAIKEVQLSISDQSSALLQK